MIYSDLGGGDNVHIGLILYPANYTIIPLTLFIRPLNPYILIITTGTTKLIVTENQTNQKVSIRTFKEVFYVGASLRHKIIIAVNVKYITALCNCNTKSTKKTINVILKNIFDTYGKITPQILTQREDVVKQMTFDVEAPIDTVFN